MDKLKTIPAGQLAEKQACKYLQQQGLHLLESNYRTRVGEIDLIMQDNDVIVFIEVRLRNNARFANSIESVDHYKQRKIVTTAMLYLAKNKLQDKVNCRFDVIGISYQQTNAELEWIQDAFSTDDF
jgi:putative endonuclease